MTTTTEGVQLLGGPAPAGAARPVKYKVSKAMRERRSSPIRAYVGPNGSGKSLGAVRDLMPSLEAGRGVLSNIRILDWKAAPGDSCTNPLCTREDDHWPCHPLYVPLVNFDQVLDAQGVDILLDEIQVVANSRTSGNLPHAVMGKLLQLRRSDCSLSYTAPSWSRADKAIRETTQLVVLSRGLLSRSKEDATAATYWRQNRLFRYRSFDATVLDSFTAAKASGTTVQAPKPIGKEWFWSPGHAVFRTYDTYDSVSRLGFADDHSGVCSTCGGKRSVPRCSCADQKRDPKPGAGAVDGGPEGAVVGPATATGLPLADIPGESTGPGVACNHGA